eukprot:1156636-Pelagomonas_calceolata.AAC.16
MGGVELSIGQARLVSFARGAWAAAPCLPRGRPLAGATLAGARLSCRLPNTCSSRAAAVASAGTPPCRTACLHN